MKPDTDAIALVLADKISNGEVIQIEMGTAYDWEMNEIPWRAKVIPLSVVKSPQGLRLRCRVDTGNDYMIVSADQTQGVKHLLLGTFSLIG